MSSGTRAKSMKVICLALLMSSSVSLAETPLLESEAASWLRSQFDFIPCDEDHFIYGVGYIDGSYMERIFYAEDSGSEPVLDIRFRDDSLKNEPVREVIVAAPFIVELRLGRAQHAVIAGREWTKQDGWDTALRFKYTSWFGDLSWSGEGWQVKWNGYRRPMLPGTVLNEPEKYCGLFRGAG